MATKRRYLYEVDFMRVFFIFGVLTVHTFSLYISQLSGSAADITNAIHASLHFTRMGFMFMTGMVLFITHYNRPLQPFKFWLKRYIAVGIPYLFWNAFYLSRLIQEGQIHSLAGFGSAYLDAVLHGNQAYLYYVLVTFQLYLVFPLLRWFLRRFSTQHGKILIGSLLFQLIMLVGIKYGLPHVDTGNWPFLLRNYGVFVLTYQVYFLTGGLLAIHYDQVGQLIDRHARLVWRLLIGALILSPLYFLYNTKVLNLSASAAKSVHQPLMMIYAFIVIVAVLLLGRRYARFRARTPNAWQVRFISLGAKLSFGIYLSQTLALWLAAALIPDLAKQPGWLVIALPITICGVFATAFAIAYFCYRTPVLCRIIGRPSIKKGARNHVTTYRTNQSNLKEPLQPEINQGGRH
ncbi:acyltransferase [Loigolactobacillus backii]|uniref:acyltransferase n=1 Tax=Loigolactobacillus backii TaxID=375175 RepID=UPI0022FDAA63|nr:acyltransferase [Loigolactobacillus backii]MDA5386715.1 acyltransferase [Loigolactobacillus backii]MDA5389240.1 acyltransferase [Loigolactobacillus backii]